jgi:hypothetical protein
MTLNCLLEKRKVTVVFRTAPIPAQGVSYTFVEIRFRGY